MDLSRARHLHAKAGASAAPLLFGLPEFGFCWRLLKEENVFSLLSAGSKTILQLRPRWKLEHYHRVLHWSPVETNHLGVLLLYKAEWAVVWTVLRGKTWPQGVCPPTRLLHLPSPPKSVSMKESWEKRGNCPFLSNIIWWSSPSQPSVVLGNYLRVF